ncbi:MAG: putative metallopeptidase [Desulfobaccales bacterium]
MKYDEAPKNIEQMLEALKARHFPHLVNAKILLLISKKKMVKRGNIVLGKIVKPTDLVKFLSRNEAPDDGYDYVIMLDHKLIGYCEEADIERVLRHELRHTFFDSDSKNPFLLVDHDFTDFHDEVELNRDDPGWQKRVSQTVALIYHQEKDDS